jgi:hypothetical protein
MSLHSREDEMTVLVVIRSVPAARMGMIGQKNSILPGRCHAMPVADTGIRLMLSRNQVDVDDGVPMVTAQ